MFFIRKVKTASGATAVQIAYKEYGRIVKINHIGIAQSYKVFRREVSHGKFEQDICRRCIFDVT